MHLNVDVKKQIKGAKQLVPNGDKIIYKRRVYPLENNYGE
jgi:hypothetical protein